MLENKNEVDKLVSTLSKVFSNTLINEIMTTPPILVTGETKLKYAKEIMRIKGISGMPVIKRDLTLSGILSIEDIIRVIENNSLEERVEKWMTKKPIFLNEEDTIMTFLELNKNEKFGRYPVINSKKKVVGVVTKIDILEWMFKKLGYIYVHDERRDKVLNKNYVSSITGENFETEGYDFKYSIDYKSVEMVGIAATKLKKFLTSKNINPELIRKISISTYEAEANVVIHSESNGILYCWTEEDKIKVFIEDFGKGIEDIDSALKEGYSTATENVREKGFGAGMGLPNMKRFSDRMTLISSSGKGVKLEMLFYFNKGE
ncbi:CBS domain-containing protein [Oceanotoga sp. DSM 15011]|jgi:anti-sigma regulatory factor (Ser/Thr protein kinase)/CBS domain-containing protein|uniref:Anti-sigma regulatory factor (Ser/Thr protein kinase) n=1 Tax=Oceanotoga teriensis TaxID=515440 RepID=A0AA45HJN5_9BACT|nr:MULTISPECIES: CBS domain-containing protein [Oceanotoga]MDO7975519.1 CBS domain-containing protein [Oceanotoga teriensis]PWJ96193.1 anti-sigma regulatory factor (Ser/Thr protein kinase) [Oceanotoga teriensis]UYO99976.1 CBS domain-containing protein [Oceanotoga sp. DSM 15011]